MSKKFKQFWKDSNRSTFTILETKHMEEIDEKGANATNLGWFTSDTEIQSKTTQGILTSTIDPRTGNVRHEWHT